MKKTGLLAALVSLAFPLMAQADNTACPGAIYMSPNGSLRAGSFSSSTEKRWFTFEGRAGRSYVITVENMSPADVQAGVAILDFMSDCAGTSLPAGSILRSGHADEPIVGTSAGGGDRLAILTPTSEGSTIYVSVKGFAAGGTFQVRVEDTTLFSDWFYVGGDYGAFTLLRNTTNSTGVFFTIRWRDGSGAILATYSGSLNANGSVYKNGAELPAVLAAATGTVEIVHNGPPDAIVANTTVLSPTSGLSFDAPFLKRVTR